LRPHGVGIYRPAAAVIPAPIAHIRVVTIKKLLIEPRAWLTGQLHRVHWFDRAVPSREPYAIHWLGASSTFDLYLTARRDLQGRILYDKGIPTPQRTG
jgi:hypothetical protein